MKLGLRTSAAAVAAVLGLAGQQSAVAQSGASAALEEVIVTSRRREENLQDVPASVVGLSAEDIEVRGMQRIEDLSVTIPNVSLLGGSFGVNQASFTMRGIPRVSTFVDGIWQATTSGLLLRNLVDIERIEVLRGPQGTLFGRDSTGGAIRIVTRRPAEEFGVRGSATIGSHDRRDLQLAVDVPVTDTFRTKWSVANLYRDGFVKSITIDRNYGSLENEIARGDLVWEPTDRFSARMIYERTQQRSNGQPRVIEGIYPGIETSNLRLNVAEQYTVAGYEFTDRTHTSGFPGGEVGKWETKMDSELDATDILTSQYTLDLQWDVTDAISFQSLTGYRQQTSKDFTDWDASELDMIEDDRRNKERDLTQEFQLSGDHGRFHWVTGLYFWDTRNVSRFFRQTYTEFKSGELDFALVEAACQAPPGGDGKTNCSIFPNLDFGSDARNEGKAVFGEVVIDLTDRLALTVGMRYHDEEQFSGTRVFSTPGPTGPDMDPPGDIFAGHNINPADAAFDHTTKRLALSHQTTDDLSFYVGYAEGFNSGGVARLVEPNPVTGVNETFLYPYRPENIKNYEVGLRSDWLDRRLRFNATLFKTDWEDIQLAGQAPDPFNPGQFLQRTLTANVAAAEAKGLELELRALPGESWEVTFNAGFLDTAYTKVLPTTTDVSLGDTFGQAPEFTGSVGVQRTFAFANAGQLAVRGDYSYTSEFTRSRVPAFQRGNVTGTKSLEGGDFGLLNLRLTYLPADARWEAALFGTNLTNEWYLNSGHTVPMWGYDWGTIGRPREVGATLRIFID